MNALLTFEAEEFDYAGSAGRPATQFEEQETWETTSPYAQEFDLEGAAPVSTSKTAGCAGYEKGELQKSRTQQGHLTTDVIAHSRGLLVADLGVNWRTPRASLKSDKALQDWLTTIMQVIKASPTTTIRIMGFSDCVGNERHNASLRRGRAFKLSALLKQMLGEAQWNTFKARVTFLDGAPVNDYVASNATVQGRAQNRSVLIENMRTIDFDPHVVQACVISPTQATTYPLLGLIPNVPDYQNYVPIDYKLDAKKIVGKVAQDVSSPGHTIHKWLDRVHWGIVGLEIAFEGSLIVSGLAIASPVLALAATFLALGLPCVEVAQEKAADWSATGYSRGLVLGADQRPGSMVTDYFANDYFPANPTCPQARNVSIANYKMGLLVGYVHGRLLCPNQRAIFFRDLRNRMGNQSYRGDSKQWGRREWVSWYVDSAAAFRKHHLL